MISELIAYALGRSAGQHDASRPQRVLTKEEWDEVREPEWLWVVWRACVILVIVFCVVTVAVLSALG